MEMWVRNRRPNGPAPDPVGSYKQIPSPPGEGPEPQRPWRTASRIESGYCRPDLQQARSQLASAHFPTSGAKSVTLLPGCFSGCPFNVELGDSSGDPKSMRTASGRMNTLFSPPLVQTPKSTPANWQDSRV